MWNCSPTYVFKNFYLIFSGYKNWWICYCQASFVVSQGFFPYIKTDGFMKLIKSLSDMAVKSCVVGEKGWVMGVDGAAVGGAALIKLPWAAAWACWLLMKILFLVNLDSFSSTTKKIENFAQKYWSFSWNFFNLCLEEIRVKWLIEVYTGPWRWFTLELLNKEIFWVR